MKEGDSVLTIFGLAFCLGVVLFFGLLLHKVVQDNRVRTDGVIEVIDRYTETRTENGDICLIEQDNICLLHNQEAVTYYIIVTANENMEVTQQIYEQLEIGKHHVVFMGRNNPRIVEVLE